MSAATLLVHNSSSDAYFESVYADARGDASHIPWADLRPNPALVSWLNAVASSIVRCGARVCVVGCGLGDDARELIKRGYEVTAFDCSATAINWARQRDPENARCYMQADLFNLPGKWRHRFDLLIEAYTIQSLPPDEHVQAMQAIAQMLSPRGHIVLIARASHRPVASTDRPWPLTEDELRHIAEAADLNIEGDVAIFEDDEDPPVLRMRAVLSRRA